MFWRQWWVILIDTAALNPKNTINFLGMLRIFLSISYADLTEKWQLVKTHLNTKIILIM